MKRTLEEIAEKLDIEKETAAGLVKFLVEEGLARFRGERPSARGKGPHVYDFPDGIGKQAGRIISRLE